MKQIAFVLFAAGLTGTAIAQTPPPASPAVEVVAAEKAFDAFTAEHGYTHGFYAYSAPGALSFQPGPVPTHEQLAKGASEKAEKDAPSTLRWWPSRGGVSKSADLAYDLGGFTDSAKAKSGWFLTIWQKQPDGKWLWVIDTSAGKGDVSALPPKKDVKVDKAPEGSSRSPDVATSEVTQNETRLNAAIGGAGMAKAYDNALIEDAIVTTDDGAPAHDDASQAAILATRPQHLTWSTDHMTVSAAGDLAYTYGHAADAGNATQGYYVRVWSKEGPASSDWWLLADIYHAGK